jgi:NAD(P)-dependent dehydrogenase (short-subunit alcohol dehydrogenase family)
VASARASTPSRLTPISDAICGASKEIGAATAEAFAAAGASVVLGARNLEALESVRERITVLGGHAIAVRTDVANVDSMRNLVDRAVATYGRLDAAFNNATDGPRPAPLAEIDPDDFDRGIATNVRAPSSA